MWNDFFVEMCDEIDERPWNQADALAHRNALNKQVGDMLDRVLPEEERNLLRLYFGIGRRRHSMDELIALFDGEHTVNSCFSQHWSGCDIPTRYWPSINICTSNRIFPDTMYVVRIKEEWSLPV